MIDIVLERNADAGLQNLRDMIAGRPDMTVTKATATAACDVSSTGVRLQGRLNGHSVSWLLDTGANFSLISDAEASRLGMTIHRTPGRAGDLAGGSAAARTATADRLTIGSTEMRHVTFLVTPAGEMPWKELPAGKQGIIGIPVALALESVQWSSDESCTFGAPVKYPSPTSGAPLYFDRLFLMTDVIMEGKPLRFTLDTGNQGGTQLWPRFGREFSGLVSERGSKSSKRLVQVGGAKEHPTTVIPAVRLTTGGRDVTLAVVHLFSPPVGHDASYGLLGIDAFADAREVSIDFRTMPLFAR